MKAYIAGKITELDNYKELFKIAETKLLLEGHAVMNPSILPEGFEHREYMDICYSMLDVCDGVYFLNNWRDSIGAKMEHEYAVLKNKWLRYQL